MIRDLAAEAGLIMNLIEGTAKDKARAIQLQTRLNFGLPNRAVTQGLIFPQPAAQGEPAALQGRDRALEQEGPAVIRGQ